MNRPPVRRYKRRRQTGTTVLIVVLSVFVVLAFVCFILALTGRLDPLVQSLLGGGETTEQVSPGPDPVTTDAPGSGPADPPQSGEVTTKAPETDPPAVSGTWIELTEADAKKGLLLWVDNEKPYSFPEDTDRVNLYQYRADNGGSGKYQLKDSLIELEREAAQALHRMLLECATVYGTSDAQVFVQTAYRSYEEQEGIYKPGSESSAKPGCSDYHTGMAVYLKLRMKNADGTYRYPQLTEHPEINSWIKESAHKYGFIVRYPSGKSEFTGPATDGEGHLRYVGVVHATAMYERDLCLEEYVAYLQSYSYQNRLGIRTDAGDFEIYSVTLKEGSSTKVPVPEDGDYLISGDNRKTVIISVPKA